MIGCGIMGEGGIKIMEKILNKYPKFFEEQEFEKDLLLKRRYSTKTAKTNDSRLKINNF